MAGAFHGLGEGESCLNVGVSGPGVVKAALEAHHDASFDELADIIKKTAFKITRMGQLVGMEAERRLGGSLWYSGSVFGTYPCGGRFSGPHP
jgi:uncharacterized protein (UPF0210 family)